MHWGTLSMFFSGLYGIGVSYYMLNKTERLKFMALFWAAVVFTAAVLCRLLDIVTTSNFAEFITAQVTEWGHVYAIVLVLGALMLFIRESKPEFSRVPQFYATFPVILAISYLLVYDTLILKQVLLSIATAGAVVVAVILYGMYSYYERIYRTIFAGSVLFLITFLLQLFLPESVRLIWQVGLTVSVITVFTGYLVVDRYYAPD